MKHIISVGEIYQHEDGDEYEVVKVNKDRVTFEASDGAIIHMDDDDLIDELDKGILVLPVWQLVEQKGDDEDEKD